MARSFNDVEMFKNLLKRAVGPYRTQAEFARETGLTPQYFSKMINSPKSVPNKSLLVQFAEHSYEPIPLKEFLSACGYREPARDIINLDGEMYCRVDTGITDIIKAILRLSPDSKNVIRTVAEALICKETKNEGGIN